MSEPRSHLGTKPSDHLVATGLGAFVLAGMAAIILILVFFAIGSG
ncbi:MAG: hypothetical protein ABI202_06130 [Candidatus Baltobacteraceae bacterium]|jgi:hypothetical protein